MKKVILIVMSVLLGNGLFFIYRSKYTYTKSGEDHLLYLIPFQDTQTDFEKNMEIAEQELLLGDSNDAKRYLTKALKFRDTFNEKQYENIYSDANGLWEYKLDKLLKYSKAYELTGEYDNAISCLSSGLMSLKWDYPIEKRFFELTVKKIGRERTFDLINTGLKHTAKINKDSCWKCYECYYCCDYYYEFGNYKIGLDEHEFELIQTNKALLISKLARKYGI